MKDCQTAYVKSSLSHKAAFDHDYSPSGDRVLPLGPRIGIFKERILIDRFIAYKGMEIVITQDAA
jgi:hypothetical protein